MKITREPLASFHPRAGKALPPALGLVLAGAISLLLWVCIAGIVSLF